MCGNGIRCVGKFVYDKGLTKNKKLTIDTLAGVKTLYLKTKNGKVDTVTVDMGEPILKPEEIPVIINVHSGHKAKENIECRVIKNLEIQVLDKKFLITPVSMGNPHAVIVVEDLENFNVEKYGSVLEIDEHFPEKANIEFVEILDKNTIKMRVWERGTGETFACGTGACATLVACNLNELVEDEVTVKLLGGDLKIKWDKQTNHIHMTGPATTVFEGVII